MDMRAANVTLTNALKRHDDNMIKQQQNMFGVESETNMLRQQLDKVQRKRSRRKEETSILCAVCRVPCAVCRVLCAVCGVRCVVCAVRGVLCAAC